jgi:hypothetical protein
VDARELTHFWDEHTARWLEGEDPLPEPLDRWWRGYSDRDGSHGHMDLVSMSNGTLRMEQCVVGELSLLPTSGRSAWRASAEVFEVGERQHRGRE